MINQLLEYMKLHLISLNQDVEDIMSKLRTYQGGHDIPELDYLMGQIEATRHLLSVATDILMSSNFDDLHYSGGIH